MIAIPEIGTLSEDEYGRLASEPRSVAALGGRECRFFIEVSEDDPHPEDVANAVRSFLDAGDGVLADATPYVHEYFIDMQALWGDEAPELDIEEPSDVWRYVDLGRELCVSRDHGDSRDIFISVECNCAWEIEHGLQLVFRNGGEISKVGPFDGHVSNESAFADPSLRGVVYRRVGD